MHTEEYDEDYEGERAAEYKAILDEEEKLLHHSSWKRNAPSIDRTVSTSFDTQPHQRNRKRELTDIAYYPSIDIGVDRVRERDYSIGSWADDHHHESYAVEMAIHEPGADEPHEDGYARGIDGHALQVSREDIADILQMANGADNLFMQQRTVPATQKGTKEVYDTSSGIDNRFKKKKIYWEEKDEYGVYRDDQGCARDVDGHIINVSKEDIRKLMKRASRDEHSYICLPEHASSFIQTKLMKLDGVYYPLNDSISWLNTCMEEMRQDIAKIQHVTDKHRPASIDRLWEPKFALSISV
ncbi:hypothetical protein DY000_02020929 [Brassica cretica]|uniref:Uncharacterized protein n=1 Tax=Brassica cretica TaxID=69181 RepID=A0ABQ7EEV7_BRACR|nr:hypothetical protein DY000_02020929 [Brassica cretica]